MVGQNVYVNFFLSWRKEMFERKVELKTGSCVFQGSDK